MGVKGDSVPFAEHETESRPERSSGKARHNNKNKGRPKYGLPTFLCGQTKKCRADKPFSSLAQETVSAANDFPYGSAQGNSPWTMSELSAPPDLRAKTSQ